MNRRTALSFALGVVSTLACVVALGATDPDRAPVGRYQVVVGDKLIVKLDTRTGEIWQIRAQDLPGAMGDWVQIAK